MKQHKHGKKSARFGDVEDLEARIKRETPEPGDYLYDYRVEALKQELSKEDPDEVSKKLRINFKDLAISESLKKGLKHKKFERLTEIQRCVIPHALARRDIMAASKTGSGKTVSYLIPIVENLYREKWTPLDGLGAIVLVPTRELAVQVFEVMKEITSFTETSIGLVIGGKSLEAEQQLIRNMTILICTPGRLLQHLQGTANFEYNNCRCLVIDEADEIIMMGFMGQVTEILEALPKDIQTMLFSATLNSKVLALGRVALKQPEKILLNEVRLSQLQEAGAKGLPTSASELYEAPKQLKQYYMMMELDEKIDNLFSFLKSHQKNKIIVFLTSCKQVRFVYSAFKKLKPGLPVLELHGRQKQPKRMAIYFTFSERKFCCLFTTAVAARGLDFPAVDWVVQDCVGSNDPEFHFMRFNQLSVRALPFGESVDCPESVEGYVHKVGRTARFNNKGKSLLFLTHQEEKFVGKLRASTLNIYQLKVNPQRLLTIKKSLMSLCTEDHELKYLAQRAIVSYLNSLDQLGENSLVDLQKLNLKGLAASYGLAQIPVINFGEEADDEDNEPKEAKKTSDLKELATIADENRSKQNKKLHKLKQKIQAKKLQQDGADGAEDEAEEPEESEPEPAGLNKRAATAKMQSREEPDTSAVDRKNTLHNSRRNKQEMKRVKMVDSDSEDESGDELLKTKRKDQEIDIEKLESNPFKLSNKALKKVYMDGPFQGRNEFVFQEGADGDTELVTTYELERKRGTQSSKLQAQSEKDYVQDYARKLEEHREQDRQTQQEKLQEKKEKKKLREKEQEHFKGGQFQS